MMTKNSELSLIFQQNKEDYLDQHTSLYHDPTNPFRFKSISVNQFKPQVSEAELAAVFKEQ